MLHVPHRARSGGALVTPDTIAVMPLDEQTSRDLSRAAANVRTWTRKRNDLIRQAAASGAGVREIARATDLNVGTVHTMLHGRKRGGTRDDGGT